MALVKKDAVYYAFDCLVEGGILKDNVGGLAAKFQSCLLIGAGNLLGNYSSDVSGAGEGNLVDVWVTDHHGSGVAKASDYVHDTVWQFCLLADFCKQQRCQRGCFGRL